MSSTLVELIKLYFRKFQLSGKMDIFAASEPREFISFHLGIEANSQPILALPGTSNTEEFPTCNNPNVAEETISPNVTKGEPGITTSFQTVPFNRLPSAIENFKGTPSQQPSCCNLPIILPL